MNDKLNAVLLVLVFIGGAGVGALVATIWVWWQLASGKRIFRKLEDL